MNPLAIVRLTYVAATQIGVGLLVGNIAKAYTPKSATLIAKIFVALGAGAIAEFIAKPVVKSAGESFDETVEGFVEGYDRASN